MYTIKKEYFPPLEETRVGYKVGGIDSDTDPEKFTGLYYVSHRLPVGSDSFIKADIKETSTSTGKKYESGFHIFKTLKDAKEYLNALPRCKQVWEKIVEVEARKIRYEGTQVNYVFVSFAPIFVAQEMRVLRVIEKEEQ